MKVNLLFILNLTRNKTTRNIKKNSGLAFTLINFEFGLVFTEL